MKKYYCKEIDCNNEICKVTFYNGLGQCRSCAMKKLWGNTVFRENLIRKRQGKNNPAFIDGRTKNQYYCKECGKKIGYRTALYKSALCHSCATPKGKNNYFYGKSKFGKDNPNFGNHKLAGENNPFFNKHHTEKSKEKIRKGNKGLKRTEEFKKFISQYNKNFYSNPKNHPQYGKFGELSPNWQGGKSFEPYPLGWTNTFKEQIRFRDGYKCQICGMSELENGRKLSVHHIDYDKQNLELNNLTSICRSCHMKTNSNRKYWKKYLGEVMQNGGSQMAGV